MAEATSAIPFSVWRKIAMATWRPRTDPTIRPRLISKPLKLLEYIDQVRHATGQHLTPVDLVGRAAGKVVEALPGLNGRVVFGSFLPSPTIDCFFVVSLRTDPVSGVEAASTDLSGTVVRRVNEKPPWVIAKELADRAGRIRHDNDPQFKQLKAMVKGLPPLLLRPLMEGIGFVTESLQLALPFLGLEARPYGSMLVSNVGPTASTRPRPRCRRFCHVPITILLGAVTDRCRPSRSTRRSSGAAPDDQSGPPVRHGYQAATMARIFREYLDDPAAFDPVPTRIPPRKRQHASVRSNGKSPATAGAGRPNSSKV